MKRVPLPLVFLVVGGTIGGVWWWGTKDLDFLKPPGNAEIQAARLRASLQVNRLGEQAIAAVDPAPTPVLVSPKLIQPPLPPPPEAADMTVEIGNLDGDPPIDAWLEAKDFPAISFINLASSLEAEGHLAWALPAWERVLDSTAATTEQRAAAVNGIRRIRTALGESIASSEPSTDLLLQISASSNLSKMTRKAAQVAVASLKRASSGIIQATPELSSSSDSETLTLSLRSQTAEQTGPFIELPAPKTQSELEEALAVGIFKLVASVLAADGDLTPVDVLVPETNPRHALEDRITRLAWTRFAEIASASE